MELRHLRAFHAVAQELSFRRASERLNIAQPALSRTIKDLEATMEVTLLERTTRVVRLTDAGRAYQQQTAHLLTDLDHAIRLAQRIHRGVAGELRVGFNDFAINGNLPEMIRRFRVDWPEIEVRLSDHPSPEMVELVLDGKLDIAFHMGRHHNPALDTCLIRDEQLICALPESHALARESIVSMRDLANEPFVLGRFQPWRLFHRVLREFCREHGFDLRLIQEAEHSDGILALVAAGMGVTLYVDADWIHVKRGVAVKPLQEATPSIESMATWRRDRREVAPALNGFLDVVSTVVKEHGSRFKYLPR